MKKNQLQIKVRMLQRIGLALTMLALSTAVKAHPTNDCFRESETKCKKIAENQKTMVDTSHLEIEDSISAYAPNIPNPTRHSAGRPFFGEVFQYDSAKMESMHHWIEDYPNEVAEFKRIVEPFFASTDPATLTYTQRSKFYDIHTLWIAIRHEE